MYQNRSIVIPLLSGLNAAASPLVATSPGSTDFTASLATNNAPLLTGHAAQNNTKTDDVVYEVVLPQGFAPGATLTVNVAAGYTLSSGTTITATVDVVANVIGDTGTGAADICATAAQAITTTVGEKAFTITGTTLTPGARLAIKVTTSVQEAGNTGTATAVVKGIRLNY